MAPDDHPPQPLKRSFPPVVNEAVRLLVLGSLPGDRSIAATRYYAHPQNQFWRLIGAVIEADLAALDYPRRLEILLRARVGLWDSVGSAIRQGSLDGNIRGHEPNPLAELVESLPELGAIGFNGATSARIGMKALGEQSRFELLPLPSSSPAYTLPFERKREAWLRLRDYL